MRLMPRVKRQNKGFTLIELLIVIALIAVLSALFINNSTVNIKRAHDAQRKSDLTQYQNALEVYSVKNNSYYPFTTSIVNDASTFLCSGSPSILGITNCPTDPSHSGTNNAYYDYQGGTGGGCAGQINGSPTATQYFLSTVLEAKDSNGNVQNFVVCSNGKSGIVQSVSNTSCGGCPLP